MTTRRKLSGWRLAPVRLGLILAATALLVVGWTNGLWPQRFVWPQMFGEGVFCVSTREPIVALTFDDGPHPVYTPAILTLLETYQAKGTFFTIGQHLAQYSQVGQELVSKGHELANHTFSHPDLNRRWGQGITQEIKQTDVILDSVTHEAQPYFRPPYGHANLLVTQTLKAMARPMAFWDIDLRDWDNLSVEQMMDILAKNIHPGAIVLMHDANPTPDDSPQSSRQKTIDLVGRILATYSPQGYQFVTLSELLSRGEPQPTASRCHSPRLGLPRQS